MLINAIIIVCAFHKNRFLIASVSSVMKDLTLDLDPETRSRSRLVNKHK